MAGEFLVTVGDSAQFDTLLNGDHLKGRADPRIAMVGRSNVGKSSLINSLLGTRLAQTSNQPGKTRKIHFYIWKEKLRIIADLPGYGFAKAGHGERDKWAAFIRDYVDRDPILTLALVLLDARHGPTELDLQAIRFLKDEGVPVGLVFSKADTLKTQSERARRHKEAAQAVKDLGYNPDDAHWVSSKTGAGMRELAVWIANGSVLKK